MEKELIFLPDLVQVFLTLGLYIYLALCLESHRSCRNSYGLKLCAT